MKLLLWLVIGAVVIWQLRGKKRLLNAGTAQRNVAHGESGSNIAEPMIGCAHCGIFVPSSEVIFSISGAAFCSEEHRKERI